MTHSILSKLKLLMPFFVALSLLAPATAMASDRERLPVTKRPVETHIMALSAAYVAISSFVLFGHKVWSPFVHSITEQGDFLSEYVSRETLEFTFVGFGYMWGACGLLAGAAAAGY